MEYENSICRYCKYCNGWDCSEGYYPTKGCENWSLDDSTLTNEQNKRIKAALMLTIDAGLTYDTDW